LYIYLSKLLPLLVLPVGIVMLSLFFALVLVWMRRRRASVGFLFFGLLVLWISSMPITAATLYGRLEQPYPPIPTVDIPASDCVVVLGGAVGPALSPRVDIELNEAVDRVYKTAQLYRDGKAQAVLVAAGNQPWNTSEQSEAELIQTLLVEWGVPAGSISLDEASRNTRENAINAKKMLDQLGCESPLLVTSAAHMPRAVAAFEKVGVRVFPVSTDVGVVDGGVYTVFDFLPQAGALVMTTEAMREWIGRRFYEFKGWN